MMSDPDDTHYESVRSLGPSPGQYREVRFEYSGDFPVVLSQLGISLLVSTYQAGKLAVIGTRDGKVTFDFHHLDQAMGVAVSSRRVALGSRRQIYFLHPTPELAPTREPRGTHDACWMTRSSFFTGNIHAHELVWGADGQVPPATPHAFGQVAALTSPVIR